MFLLCMSTSLAAKAPFKNSVLWDAAAISYTTLNISFPSPTIVSDLDVVPRANSAVVPVPSTINIHLVDLAQEVHRLTLHRVNVLQLLDDVNIPG